MPLLFLISMLTRAPDPIGAPEPTPASVETRGGGLDSKEEARAVRRPTVHLIVDESLTQWLVVRLLEDGYPLTASPAAAHVQLAVVSNAEGTWSVTATGQSIVAFDVEAATDLAVMRLELLHRSIDAVEDVVPVVPTQPQPASVSLAVTELSPPSLAPQVAAGILAAGATLVPTGGPAQLRVCAAQRADEESPRISVIEGDGECDDPMASESVAGGVSALPSTMLMVADAMATLAAPDSGPDEVADAEPEPAVPEEPGPVKDSERPPGLEATSRRVRMPRAGAPLVLRAGVAAGVFGRVSVADAFFAASMTVGREPGIQAWLEVQARPVEVVGRFRVIEVFPGFGFKVRPLSIRRFSLEVGALVGPEIHSYELRLEQAPAQGRDVSASAESALGFAFKLWKEHEIHVALRVGGSSQRIHRVEGVEVWRRRGLRIGATVGFSFGRRLRT